MSELGMFETRTFVCSVLKKHKVSEMRNPNESVHQISYISQKFLKTDIFAENQIFENLTVF